jgi:hypothetical protein
VPIIVVLVVVLCCVVGSIGGYLIYRAVSSTAPAVTAANHFLDDLTAGDDAAAYQRLCTTTQANYTLDEFTAAVQGQPHIRRHRVVGVSTSTVNGTRTALVTVDLTLDTGAPDTHALPLVREGGHWRVCGDPY